MLKPLLNVQNLSITRGNKIISEQLAFEILPGEFWGVLGINGRGKSTLLHTIAGLFTKFKGDIWVSGDHLNSLSRKRLAQRMGLLLQQASPCFPISALEAIEVGRYAFKKGPDDSKQLRALIECFQLDPLIDKNIMELSGGEQQRISIMRLLYQNPILFLLDEPSNNLDLIYQQKILAEFKNKCDQHGAAVIMTGHNLAQMEKYCSHFLLMLTNGDILLGNKKDILTPGNLELVYGS